MRKPDLKSDVKGERTLLVWDAEGVPPSGNWTTVFWSSFGQSDNSDVISIPALIEKQADALKARYLAWIYELGEAHINGKRLVDHLELRPGFSYWWMTSLAQKFNASGSSQIDNAVKALVFESLVAEHKPKSIVLISSKKELALVLQSFCRTMRLHFKWNRAKLTENSEPFSRFIYNLLPHPIQAFAYFVWYLVKNFPLLCTQQNSGSALNGEITFVDVLVHLDNKAFTTGKFVSNYWTGLVNKLAQSNLKTNWLHNFFRQESIPTPVRAYHLIGRFNKHSSDTQSHALIEASLGPATFIQALKDYFRICRISFHLPIYSPPLLIAGSVLNLWPLLKREWMDSLRGREAIVNCLRIALFEKTFSRMPCQKLGIYIQENQPWEMALIYAWKVAGHGKLIGVPHTTVRYGDLRYFYDARSYNHLGKNALPTPDLVAINGPAAKKLYLEAGYPKGEIIEVEALRFLHLLSNSPVRKPVKTSGKKLKILVCGDFLAATNYRMLAWMECAAKRLPPETTFVLKPHPACPVKGGDFPSLALEVTNAPLAELFADCTVVFTSNITSAAVDAYCSGVPVVQMLDGSAFNMSPLRGMKGVMYVTTPAELSDLLSAANDHKNALTESYFYLDANLSRWQKLINKFAGASIRHQG